MLAGKLKKGDIIGVVSPCNLVDDDDMDIIRNSLKLFKEKGYEVKFGENCFKNTTQYGATAKEKAEDINNMYADKEVKAILTLKGGYNSNSVYEYLDLELIKKNNKIICGYSDATSYINYIVEKTGNIGFIGPNFKTVTSSETTYCYEQLIKHICDSEEHLLTSEDECYLIEMENENVKYIKEKRGITAEGELIGGNLSMISELSKELTFENKILFLEDFAFEARPQMVSNYIYNLKQQGIFNKINGLWLGYYEAEIPIEKIVLDTISDLNVRFPIIKSNNFGHTEKIMTIPLGIKARIEDNNIKIIEDYLI